MGLHCLSRFIHHQKFHMLILQSILPLLPRGSWMASLDLQDVYFHLTISPQHCHFFQFCIVGMHYWVLPFRLSTAPRVFTKCMVLAVAHLRKKQILVFPYIDDWLLVSHSPQQLSRCFGHTLSTIPYRTLCESPVVLSGAHSGPPVNWSNSSCPSWQGQLTAGQSDHHTSLADRLLFIPNIDAHSIQCLLSCMTATSFVIPWARLWMHPVQTWFLRHYKPTRDS